jgi:hypothetical protein
MSTYFFFKLRAHPPLCCHFLATLKTPSRLFEGWLAAGTTLQPAISGSYGKGLVFQSSLYFNPSHCVASMASPVEAIHGRPRHHRRPWHRIRSFSDAMACRYIGRAISTTGAPWMRPTQIVNGVAF